MSSIVRALATAAVLLLACGGNGDDDDHYAAGPEDLCADGQATLTCP